MKYQYTCPKGIKHPPVFYYSDCDNGGLKIREEIEKEMRKRRHVGCCGPKSDAKNNDKTVDE